MYAIKTNRDLDAAVAHRPGYLPALVRVHREEEPEVEEPLVRGQVTLATLHSSKGLEWDHVFIIGCEEGTIPHKRVDAARASDAIAGDLDEERRLFYVGITRARETLDLCRAETRIDRGRELPVKPSRFLDELPGSVQDYDLTKEERLTVDKMDAMANAFLAKFAESEAN